MVLIKKNAEDKRRILRGLMLSLKFTPASILTTDGAMIIPTKKTNVPRKIAKKTEDFINF